MAQFLATVAVAVPVGVLTWRRLHPASWWLYCGFPFRCILVLAGWRRLAYACGLSKPVKRWRRSQGVWNRVVINAAPWIGCPRPTRYGWEMTAMLRPGQTPETWAKTATVMAHAWRVPVVKVIPGVAGRVRLIATRVDPLAKPSALPATQHPPLLTANLGQLDTGRPWLVDLKVVPHWLVAGATQSGKSNAVAAVLCSLAPQPVALVGIDCKGGVELSPFAPRFSSLVTTRPEALDIATRLLDVAMDRMAVCRAAGARNIWRLPDDQRPTPIVIVVDEVAELCLAASKADRDEAESMIVALVRLAQLGRAFGVHLVVCGQRVGSDLGPGVTALRAQLGGRICHRVNDSETASMTLSAVAKDAVLAAQEISPSMPGLAITATADGAWSRARARYVSEVEAVATATKYAALAVPLDSVPTLKVPTQRVPVPA